MQQNSTYYCPYNLVDQESADGTVTMGEWHREEIYNLFPACRLGSNMHGRNAFLMRENLCSHFLFDGAISFQWNRLANI